MAKYGSFKYARNNYGVGVESWVDAISGSLALNVYSPSVVGKADISEQGTAINIQTSDHICKAEATGQASAIVINLLNTGPIVRGCFSINVNPGEATFLQTSRAKYGGFKYGTKKYGSQGIIITGAGGINPAGIAIDMLNVVPRINAMANTQADTPAVELKSVQSSIIALAAVNPQSGNLEISYCNASVAGDSGINTISGLIDLLVVEPKFETGPTVFADAAEYDLVEVSHLISALAKVNEISGYCDLVTSVPEVYVYVIGNIYLLADYVLSIELEGAYCISIELEGDV